MDSSHYEFFADKNNGKLVNPSAVGYKSIQSIKVELNEVNVSVSNFLTHLFHCFSSVPQITKFLKERPKVFQNEIFPFGTAAPYGGHSLCASSKPIPS